MATATFFTNLALGFILAMEFGQTSVEILRRGIRNGFKQAIMTSLGGTFADFIYLNIAITGIIYLLNRPEILKPLWIIGGLAVLLIAIKGLRVSGEINDPTDNHKDTHSFIIGFMLNFLHPLNLIWWVTILSSIIISDIQKNSTITAYLNGFGIVVGVLCWWTILSVLTSVAKQKLPVKILNIINRGSSVALIGFSFWFFYNGFII